MTYRCADFALETTRVQKKKKEKAHQTLKKKKRTDIWDISQLKCNGLLITWTVAINSGANLSSTLIQNIGVSQLLPPLPPAWWLFPTISPRGDISIRNVTVGDSLFHFHSEILLVECLCANNEGAVNSHSIYCTLPFDLCYAFSHYIGNKYSEQPSPPLWEMTNLVDDMDIAARSANSPDI